MNFNSLRDAYREEVIRTRRAFHAAPELSGHEWNTAERHFTFRMKKAYYYLEH